MKHLPIVGVGALIAVGVASACGPPPPPPPLYCGQTQDESAVVALAGTESACPAGPNGRRIIVAEPCGPLMPGSNVADDCWLGNIPGRTSPDVFRLGSIQIVVGGQAFRLVASDGTAP